MVVTQMFEISRFDIVNRKEGSMADVLAQAMKRRPFSQKTFREKGRQKVNLNA